MDTWHQGTGRVWEDRGAMAPQTFSTLGISQLPGGQVGDSGVAVANGPGEK